MRDAAFQGVKCSLCGLCPFELAALFCQGIEGQCNFGEACNKGAIKIAKTMKRADILYAFGGRPVSYPSNFHQVHTCHPLFKDYPQVINGGGMKRALGQFEVEGLFFGNLEDITDSIDVGLK